MPTEPYIAIPTDAEDDEITAAALLDPDNPPLSDEELSQLVPARKRGRPSQDFTKVPTSIRLDAAVLDSFRATGPGWQTRINQVLLEHLVENDMIATRFHAVVLKGEPRVKIHECLVLATDEKQAQEKVRAYLLQVSRTAGVDSTIETEMVGHGDLTHLPLRT